MTTRSSEWLAWSMLVGALAVGVGCGTTGNDSSDDASSPGGGSSGSAHGGNAGSSLAGHSSDGGDAGTGGSAGAAGKSASGGNAGTAGVAGNADSAGHADAGASGSAGHAGAGIAGSAGVGGSSGSGGSSPIDSLTANRERLLGTYFSFLKNHVASAQSNGLSGSNVTSECDVWMKLDPSSQAVFLTLTARMQGSVLGADGSSMLSHVVTVYRIAGGQGATATAPGSCGGGEYNRMIMSMDAELHDAQVAVNAHQGALQPNGKFDIADILANTSWRDSHDLGGPHTPFTQSDETNQGAPRGQTQYFADPTTAPATAPLGRMDLETLVDPYALEMDQDYDCIHNSNPDCAYITYGPACLLQASLEGTGVYTKTYGSFDPSWMPTCD